MDGRRYPPAQNPDISDDTDHDTPVRDWVVANKKLAVVFALIGTLVLIALWVFLKPFFTSLRNPITYGVLGFLVYTGFVWLQGRKSRARQEQETATAVVKMKNGAKVYDCDIDTDRWGNKVLYPISGYRFFGLRPVYLQVGEVSQEYADVIGSGAEDDDRFTITIGPDKYEERLHERHGHVLVAVGSELEANTATPNAGVRLGEPNTVDEDSYHDLASAFNQLRDVVNSLEDENETLRVERDRFARMLQEAPQPEVERFIEQYVKMREVEQPNNQHAAQPAQVLTNPVEQIRQGGDDE